MAGYRVSVEGEDPLHVDEKLCADQWMKQRLVIHSVVSLFTFGMWLPILIGWLVTLASRRRNFSSGYTVRIDGAQLTVGTSTDSRAIPLDSIGSITVSSGLLTITPRGVPQFQVYGLVNPAGAARAILEARDAYVRGMSPGVRAQALEADEHVAGERRRSGV